MPITCPRIALTGARAVYERDVRGSRDAYWRTFDLVEAREGSETADALFEQALGAIDCHSWTAREGAAQAMHAFTN